MGNLLKYFLCFLFLRLFEHFLGDSDFTPVDFLAFHNFFFHVCLILESLKISTELLSRHRYVG